MNLNINFMKIKSKIDVITNSSSEVYTRVDYNTLMKLKDFIDNFLKTLGDSRKFDDLFSYKFIYNDKYYKSKRLDSTGKDDWDALPERDKVDFIASYEYDEEYPGSIRLEFKAKDDNFKQFENILGLIANGSINKQTVIYG